MKVSELKYGAPIRVRIPSTESGYPAEFDTDFVGCHDGFVVIWVEPYTNKCIYDGVLPEWCSVYDLRSNEWVNVEADRSMVATDNVNHPSHYTQGTRETIDIMADLVSETEFKGYLKCNVVKYLSRYQYKNGVEDLEKANWYLKKLIEVEKEKEN